MIWYCIIIHTTYAEWKSPRNYFHGLSSKLVKTMFCGFCCLIISGCVLLFYLLKGFLPHCTVFSWGIGPCVWHITVCANSSMESTNHLPLGRSFGSVFRDDSVEPYVPSVLNGYSIERFPRHRERAVKHL